MIKCIFQEHLKNFFNRFGYGELVLWNQTRGGVYGPGIMCYALEFNFRKLEGKQ